MLPQISISPGLTTVETIVVVLRQDDSSIPQSLLSMEERQFVAEQKAKKINQVSFPRENHWTVIRFLPAETGTVAFLEACRKAGDDLQKWINKQHIDRITLLFETASPAEILAVAEGMAMGNYQFIKYKTRDTDRSTLQKIAIYSPALRKKDLQLLNATLSGLFFARDLINEPYSYMTTAAFVGEVSERAKKAGLVVEVLEKKRLEALQMGGILGVNRGSKEPPAMLIIEHKPLRAKNRQPLVLVGKGVVYDTGGMNLKPEKSMENMKHDMAGGAAVAGAMIALAEAGLPVHVIGLIPVTDNRPGEEAIVSGDVLHMHNGMTVEVINTDAEGRLILADALSYASRYKPFLAIDLSTLTGSAIRALGKWAIAGMESDASTSMKTIKEAGDQVYERIVEFPLWPEYGEPLKSDIADIRNLGGLYAGVIIAGKFLQRFAPFPYIHLDIAGPAFLEERDSYRGKGGTGTGVRLLMHFFQQV